MASSDGSGEHPARRRLQERPLLGEHRVALTISLGLWALAGFLFIAVAVPGLSSLVDTVDERVYRLAVDLQAPAGVDVAKALNVIGSSTVTWPIMAAVAAYLAVRRRWEALGFWAVAMTVSQLAIGPVKVLFGRARPPLALVETSGASFPSGHAVAGAAIAAGLVIVLVPAGPRRRILEFAAVVAAAAMAMSRVYLRAHWLSDVVAGAAFGAAVAIGAAVLVHRFDEWLEAAADRSHRD